MELEEFITTTLLSIKRGIRAANVASAEDEGKILGEDATIQYQIDKKEKNGGINFDVAVTVSNGSKKQGGGKIRVAVLDVGGEKSSSSQEEHVSRISFSIDPFRSVH
jgi:hypothetical protein